ncbi:MAG: transaldolase [Bryobacteraceae bacterium]|jgi:transaldolase
MNPRRKAVFLDRDGVLNRAIVRDGRPYPPTRLDELELLPGVASACAALRASGYLLILVTNQPDVARGKQTLAGVEAMNRAVIEKLRLDGCEVCAHDDGDGCECRKPQPGLLTAAARTFDVDLAGSFMVGDRWRDIEAGRRAGCRTVFIDRGYREKRPAAFDHSAPGLPGAAEWILAWQQELEGTMSQQFHLGVKIFADGANLESMLRLAGDPRIQGFTTNPTLMRQAGVRDYEAFAREVVAAIPDRPISFEVFSDDLEEMRRQALHIASWGANVNVKVPVTNTKRESAVGLLRVLAAEGVKLNVTALMTLAQVEQVAEALAGAPTSYVSVFAGRIADTGRDPVPIMAAAVEALRPYPHLQLIWASPRELLNVFQADATGCHIITVTPDLLKKMALVGRDLDEFSLDTVKMFYTDACAAGFTLDVSPAPAEQILRLAEGIEKASEVPGVTVPLER